MRRFPGWFWKTGMLSTFLARLKSARTNIFDCLVNPLSSRGRALSLYRRGIARTKKHDQQGAIDDYTATIDMPNAPSDVKAMARYNRALVHMATGDYRKGVDDLDVVLAIDEAPSSIKRLAGRRLAKRESRSRQAEA